MVIDGIQYYDDVLRPWINAADPADATGKRKRKFIVRRDPRDISIVYFFDPDVQQYFSIPYRNTAHPPMSIWEFREVRRQLRAEGQKAVNENLIFSAYNRLRALEERPGTPRRRRGAPPRDNGCTSRSNGLSSLIQESRVMFRSIILRISGRLMRSRNSMAKAVAHLNESAQAALELSEEERIAHIRRPRWIGYSRAKNVLSQLEDLLTHPKTHRMPSLLVIGDTNAGKTMLANRFVQLHPACDNPDGDAAVVPVLLIQAPPGPDENRFYESIFETLFAPYRPRDRVAQKQFQVLRLLKHVHLCMLIIDEIQNILSGSVSKQRQFLNVLKYLGNDLKIALVGLGTQEALRAIQTDPQLANRFKPAPLPRWQMDREFFRLLASFEHTLPLRHPSGLIEKRLAQQLFAQSEGSLGELATLLTTAAIYAVETGIEHINADVLGAIDWVPPSERRRQAERLV